MRREVWHGRPLTAWGGSVVVDEADLLALYMPEGGPLRFAPDFFGAPHPWSYRDHWVGHGVLQLQRPGDRYAVWVFWRGEAREFTGWYVNLQEPFRRTERGVDTHDLELDIVVSLDGSWHLKDDEQLEGWVERGRWTPAEVAEIRAEGSRVGGLLDQGCRWWSDEWAEWRPDPEWPQPTTGTAPDGFGHGRGLSPVMAVSDGGDGSLLRDARVSGRKASHCADLSNASGGGAR